MKFVHVAILHMWKNGDLDTRSTIDVHLHTDLNHQCTHRHDVKYGSQAHATEAKGITQWWPATSNSCLLPCTSMNVLLAGSLVLTSSLDVDRRFDV
jgi:hypothetical protein